MIQRTHRSAEEVLGDTLKLIEAMEAEVKKVQEEMAKVESRAKDLAAAAEKGWIAILGVTSITATAAGVAGVIAYLPTSAIVGYLCGFYAALGIAVYCVYRSSVARMKKLVESNDQLLNRMSIVQLQAHALLDEESRFNVAPTSALVRFKLQSLLGMIADGDLVGDGNAALNDLQAASVRLVKGEGMVSGGNTADHVRGHERAMKKMMGTIFLTLAAVIIFAAHMVHGQYLKAHPTTKH